MKKSFVACLLAAALAFADTLAFVGGTESDRQLAERCADLRERLLCSGIRGTEARTLIRDIQLEYDRLLAGGERRQDDVGPGLVTGLGIAAASALAARPEPAVRTATNGDDACNGIAQASCGLVEVAAGPAALITVCCIVGGVAAVVGLGVLVYHLVRDRAERAGDEPYRPGDRLNALIARYNALSRLEPSTPP
jgi:hypothetical protein